KALIAHATQIDPEGGWFRVPMEVQREVWPTESEQAVNQLAVRHIGEAAKESGLTARAEKNTADMLKGLLGSLGFERVTVRYGDDQG
ncbi:DUF4230 domain-containing protein, partial [Streptomyces cyaneofuscatus]